MSTSEPPPEDVVPSGPPTPPPPPPPPPPLPAREAAPEMPALADAKIGLLSRLSDRINPILVREVQQALNGKAFLITASLALFAIILIALVTAGQQEISPREGRQTFSIALMVLAPILMFIVPWQAFLSMRSEVQGGTVEHLMMSRLGPAAIVRGKLMAAIVQFVIYLAIFSPLIGMTFLLRGVDVPLIATMLTLAFVYAIAASALGIACGTLCRWPSIFRLIPFAIMLIGLLWFTGICMIFIESESSGLRRMLLGDQTGRFLSMALIPVGVFVVLASMISSAVLAHPYENRSTKFRVFALAAVLVGAAWIYLDWRAYTPTGASGIVTFIPLGETLFYLSASSAMVLFLFAFFAATEPRKLSPRVRARVPKNRWLALLVAPLLPGAGRGLIFTVLLGALSLATVYFIPRWAGAPLAPPFERGEPDVALLAWLEVLLYCGVAAFVRSLMNEHSSRNWIARATLPVLLILSAVIPLLVNILGRTPDQLRDPEWTPLSVFNPAYTIDAFEDPHSSAVILPFVIPLACFLLLLNGPSIVRGVREVLRASAERREREGAGEPTLEASEAHASDERVPVETAPPETTPPETVTEVEGES